MSGELVENPRRLTERIRAHIESVQRALDELAELVVEAYDGRVWEPLGYDCWDSYIRAEFYSMGRLRLDRDERRDLVVRLRSAGMSTRAIGTALGVHHDTVAEDSRVGNPTPAPVTGLDGKSYEPTKPIQVQHSTTTTEKTVETPVTVDSDTGEVIAEQEAARRLNEWVHGGEDSKRVEFQAAFARSLLRARSAVLDWDVQTVADLAEHEQLDSLEELARSFTTFAAKVRAGRGGLRVMDGGAR